MIKFEPPHITGKTVPEQIRQLESYLRNLSEQLNMAMAELERGNTNDSD